MVRGLELCTPDCQQRWFTRSVDRLSQKRIMTDVLPETGLVDRLTTTCPNPANVIRNNSKVLLYITPHLNSGTDLERGVRTAEHNGGVRCTRNYHSALIGRCEVSVYTS